MDVEMPALDGIEATRMISEYVPGARIVIVSASPRRFAVASHREHVFPDIEDVVEQRHCYWIVQRPPGAR